MMKKVYICASFGGNAEENIEKMKEYAKYALLCGTAPVVPQFYALCLNNHIPEERILGMEAGMSLLWFCDELWVFGEVIGDVMKRQIHFCNSLNIKIRYIKESQVQEKLMAKR